MSAEPDTTAAVGGTEQDNAVVTAKLRQITEATEESYSEQTDLIIEAGALSVSVRLSDEDKRELVDLLEPT